MANKSKDLKNIFNRWLNRLEEERNRPFTRPSVVDNRLSGNSHHIGSPYSGYRSDDDTFEGIIYFYEWSDINRNPKSFFTLNSFEKFLLSSQLYLASYQKELLRNIKNSYVACRKDGKDIIIKCSFESLKHALENEDRVTNPFRSVNNVNNSKEPYNVQVTRIPQPKQDNFSKVLSCSYDGMKSSIQRPPMYVELENRWNETLEWYG